MATVSNCSSPKISGAVRHCRPCRARGRAVVARPANPSSRCGVTCPCKVGVQSQFSSEHLKLCECCCATAVSVHTAADGTPAVQPHQQPLRVSGVPLEKDQAERHTGSAPDPGCGQAPDPGCGRARGRRGAAPALAPCAAQHRPHGAACGRYNAGCSARGSGFWSTARWQFAEIVSRRMLVQVTSGHL